MDEKRLLEVRDLKVHFFTDDGVVKAVDGVSFHVDKGETLAVVGESGSGKSVTALSIMRILPEPAGRIVGGSTLFRGQELTTLPEKGMRKIRGEKIAMVYQEPMTALNPAFTVGDQLGEVFRFHQRLKKKEALDRAIDLLRRVGIPSPGSRVRDYPHQLSGGMRQRAVIAMAMACNPEVLIADEPVTALDVTIQAQILDLMRDLQRDFGSSIIIITHNLGVVSQMTDYVTVMYLGKIVKYAPVQALFHSPLHPYTEGLLNSVPVLGRKGQKVLVPIEGMVPTPTQEIPGCAFAPRCPKAMDICTTRQPALLEQAPEHLVACWLHAPTS